MTGDWLPGSRSGQLAMAKNWKMVLEETATTWGVPQTDVNQFSSLITMAENILAKATAIDRNVIVTAQLNAIFDTLCNRMRDMKRRYFLSPPLDDAGLVALGLRPHDTTATPIPAPMGQATVDVSYPGVSRLRLQMHDVDKAPRDPRADYGFRIYFGILPPGGASVEDATGGARYLMKPVMLGKDLPHSQFTRRRRIIMDFPQEDSGKTAYFCIRYENAKGEQGPWGPMVSAVIP